MIVFYNIVIYDDDVDDVGKGLDCLCVQCVQVLDYILGYMMVVFGIIVYQYCKGIQKLFSLMFLDNDIV